jgi:hypothetical protein
MKNNSRDIFASDVAFLSFGGAMLMGVGLVMVILALICRFGGGGVLCGLELVPFPRLSGELHLLNRDFISINLPLGLLIIGIGLQLFTRLGWVVSVAILFIFALIFGTAMYAHQAELMEMGRDYIYIKAAILHLCFLLLTLGSLFYLFTPSVRKLYWT